MKKVGILTYHNTVNYGAMLQAYALQSKITELGFECEIINYHCKNIEERENLVFPHFQVNLINYLKKIRAFYYAQKKKRSLFKFKSNMVFSKESYDRESIKNVVNIYDKIIVGSDMVFELGINGGDMSYYLDFVPANKRYSFAACLGRKKIDDRYLKKCKNELEKFQYLSVREVQTQKYLSTLLESKVYLDIDPTLLYDCSFWKKLEEIPSDNISNRYLLLYFVNESMPEFEMAKKIAIENNYDIYIIMDKKRKVDGCKVISYASVGEFLYYIHHASLVITGSFHGMIFSMNYNTNFFYFSKNEKNTKLDNMAKLVKCTDRKLSLNNVPKINHDFKHINEAIKKLRDESMNHLQMIIFDEKR